MFRHLLRFAVLLAILGAVSLAAAALLEETEPVRIEWNGWILETHLWVAVAALILGFASAWLAISLLLGAFSTPGRIHRAWRERRRERGMLALGKAFASYAAEDGKGALASARRAERLLGEGRVRWVHPDCGFWMLRRPVADAKIRALVEGRDLYEGRTRRAAA